MNKTTLNSQKEKHSMLSLRRATPRRRRCTAFRTYFYPRPPCGERLSRPCSNITRLSFLSTLSLQRATWLDLTRSALLCYFYPRSPCGERLPFPARSFHSPGPISIHALLAESDVVHVAQDPSPGRISIHALLAESDHLVAVVKLGNVYFYPRSPCGERRVVLLFVGKPADISIHALLAESDGLRRRDLRSYLGYFYPRSPCGERHWAAQQYAKAQTISIHALLAESDPARMLSTRRSTLFLSTLSLRRATLLFYITSALRQISIHALLAESDRARAAEGASARIFLSTLSLRRATILT